MTANRDTRHRIPPSKTQRARDLRHGAPVPERVLWGMLRDRRLAGLKFRRQVPVGPYFADFYCADALLVVELDGETHIAQGDYDDRRTAYMETKGLRVLRITNDDLLEHAEAVHDEIERVAKARIAELASQAAAREKPHR